MYVDADYVQMERRSSPPNFSFAIFPAPLWVVAGDNPHIPPFPPCSPRERSRQRRAEKEGTRFAPMWCTPSMMGCPSIGYRPSSVSNCRPFFTSSPLIPIQSSRQIRSQSQSNPHSFRPKSPSRNRRHQKSNCFRRSTDPLHVPLCVKSSSFHCSLY